MAFTPKFTLFELTTRVETPVVKITLQAARPRHDDGGDLWFAQAYDTKKLFWAPQRSVYDTPTDIGNLSNKTVFDYAGGVDKDRAIEVAEQLCIHHAASMPDPQALIEAMKKAPDSSWVTLDSCLPMETKDGQ